MDYSMRLELTLCLLFELFLLPYVVLPILDILIKTINCQIYYLPQTNRHPTLKATTQKLYKIHPLHSSM